MSGRGCWLSLRVAEAVAGVMRAEAERLAAALRAADGSLDVAVMEGPEGVVVTATGVGLAGREFGGVSAAPLPVVGAVVDAHKPGMAAAVAAAVNAALGGG